MKASFTVRDGKFDVIIVEGPQVETWPSIGVRTLSTLCSEMGLTVGHFGGESLRVKGVIPLPGTGGLALIEDAQHRIHRIQARTIVRIVPESTLPDPFSGWRSQGLIPIRTAERLRQRIRILWKPMTVILGTGNRALRFGSELLESDVSEVLMVETYSQWKAKRFSGWEVERRRFEMAGGKMIEAMPIQLAPKAPLLWQLKMQESQGIRTLDVGRVVSAGPFRDLQGVREYPPGSLLFEMEQTASALQSNDIEGWAIEEERGNWLAGKIIKALVAKLGPKRGELDRIFRKARGRLKRYYMHRELPFTPSYQGKWLALSDSKQIRAFPGVPQKDHLIHPIASIECFEEIPCNLCEKVCPTSAIQIGKGPRSKNLFLNESACTSCGLCLTACPSGIIPMIEEHENQSLSRLTLHWKGAKPWSPGEFAIILNRRGESLGTARVVDIFTSNTVDTLKNKSQLVTLDVPTHLIWEVRAIKRKRLPASTDEVFLASDQMSPIEEKVEITLNGEKRLVRDRVPISMALFEIGQCRPNDTLMCTDGTCGLCDISVNNVKKPACQTRIQKGIAIKIDDSTNNPDQYFQDDDMICPCIGVKRKEVIERLKQGNLRSPEAILSVTHVGEGKCHGQLCMGAFKRMLLDQGLEISQWIDWRFPWSDWILTHK